MTNGEKIKAVLKPREYEIKIYGDWVEIEIQRLGINFSCMLEWWNAEYIEPATKNDLGVDCISRADAIQAMQDKAKKLTNEDTINGLCGAVAILFDMPSVTPQPRKGHWITKDGKEQGYDIGGVKTWYIQIMCDKCGFIKTAIEGYTGQYHFCPNCGADMRGNTKRKGNPIEGNNESYNCENWIQ